MERMWTPWRMEYIMRDKQPGCLFCEMLEAQNDREMLILHRGEHAFLVLNKYPYNNGHLMSVPYQHVSSPEDLSPEGANDMMALAALAVRAMRASLKPDGFNLGINIGKVAGAGVIDHLHCHVVPRWGGDTNFMQVFAEVRLIPQAIDETYALLKGALDELLKEGRRET